MRERVQKTQGGRAHTSGTTIASGWSIWCEEVTQKTRLVTSGSGLYCTLSMKEFEFYHRGRGVLLLWFNQNRKIRYAEYFGIESKGVWDLRGGHRWRQEDQLGGYNSHEGRKLGEPTLPGIEERESI